MLDFQKAQLEDAQVLADIEVKAFSEEIAMYRDTPGFFAPPGYGTIEEHLKHMRNSTYFKILEDGEITGGIIVFDKSEEAYLYKLFITPDLQNKGIGTQAVWFVERELAKVKKWSLHTPYLSYRNHYFYEKLGYLKVGETTPKVPGGFYLFTYEKYIYLSSATNFELLTT